jgi:Rieske Fe-S protein
MKLICRRTMLKAGIAAGVGFGMLPSSLRGQDAATSRPRKGDLLIKTGASPHEPLRVDDVRPGARPLFAWAMDPADGTVRNGSRLNQVLVLRLDDKRLTAETRARAVEGVVAYTAVCTHAGCDVDDWLTDQQILHCSCHGSQFDPKDGARVLGGEAPRPLPALPLALDRGRLVVAGPFTARVGFQPA